MNQGATLSIVRTDTTVSRLGKAVLVAAPTSYGLGHVAVNGPIGPLDIVVSAPTGKATATYSALFHTQVRAALTVTLSRPPVPSDTGGTVSATVTDAGDPVAGAKGTFGGVTVATNRRGRATVTVPAHTHQGSPPVRVVLTSHTTSVVPLTID